MNTVNTAPSSLGEWLGAIEPDERFALCVVAIIFGSVLLAFIIGFISYTIRGIHRSRLETDLKRELLDRGLSVDEVATIVAATGTTKSP